MILRMLGEIREASYADLKESLTWWLSPKLIRDDDASPATSYKKAMISGLTAELGRRTAAVDEVMASLPIESHWVGEI